jgi:hypothetical protein
MIQLGDASGGPFLTDVRSLNQALGSLNAEALLSLNGQGAVAIQVLTIGTQTLSFEGTVDGTNYFAVNAFPIVGGASITSTTANGNWIVMASGYTKFRVRCSAYTSGSATVSVNASAATNEQAVQIGTALGSTTSGQLSQLVSGAVTTAAPSYTTAQNNALSLTTGGSLRTDLSSQAGTAITAVPVAVGTGAPSGNAQVVNAAIFGGVSPAGGATAATTPAGALAAGARAQNANPTAVTNGQMVNIAADLGGRLLTAPLAYRTLWGATATTISATGVTTIAAAGGASVFRDISKIIITTAGAVAQTITLTDGTTSFIADYPNAAVAPGAPFVLDFSLHPWRATTANTAWTANQSLATACHYLVQFVDRLA